MTVDPGSVSSADAAPSSDPGLERGLRAAFARPAEEDAEATSTARALLAGLRRGEVLDALGVAADGADGHRPDFRRRYEVDSELARGGVGVILRARDTRLARPLAVKVLRDEFLDQPEAVRRFVEEAQIAGQLQHPGIVPVHDLGLDAQDRPFFTMKLVEGRTLSSLLHERGSPADDLPRLERVFEQICEAVAYAHARGVVHRDLKPSNVMVGEFGEVQVLDWGFAKVLPRSDVVSVPTSHGASAGPLLAEPVRTIRTGSTDGDSHAGSVFGTPAYMPPEQALGRVTELDERADVFALGAILCEVLTGAAPYVGDSTREVALRAARADLADAHTRLGACGGDGAMASLTMRCLEPDPGDRPRDAGELALEVTRHLATAEQRARDAELDAAEARVRALGERRSRLLTLSLAVAVLLAVAIGGYAAWSGAERDRQLVASVDQSVQAALIQASVHAGWGAWESMGEALRHADALRGDVQLPTATAARLRSLRGLATAGARTDAFLQQLRELRADEDDDPRGFEDRYRSAFAAFGIDVDGLSVEEAAAPLRAAAELVPDVALEAALALDDWAWRRRFQPRSDGGDAAHLVAIADSVDADPWRMELRSATLDGDLDRLRSLRSEIDDRPVPASSLVLLAMSLSRSGDSEAGVDVLDRAAQEHPGDFFANYRLAAALSHSDPGEIERASRHAAAALAVQPESVAARCLLANLALDRDDPAEARRVIDEAIAVDSESLRAQLIQVRVLRAGGELEQGEARERMREILLEHPGLFDGPGARPRRPRREGRARPRSRPRGDAEPGGAEPGDVEPGGGD